MEEDKNALSPLNLFCSFSAFDDRMALPQLSRLPKKVEWEWNHNEACNIANKGIAGLVFLLDRQIPLNDLAVREVFRRIELQGYAVQCLGYLIG